jgi:hypothetical protein
MPEFKEVSAERDLIAKHEAAVEARLKEVTKERDRLLAELAKMNTEWIARQTGAAERLNEVIESEAAGGQ